MKNYIKFAMKVGEQVRSYPIKIANEILDFIIRVTFDEREDDFLL